MKNGNNNKSLFVFVGCFFVLVIVVFLGSSRKERRQLDRDQNQDIEIGPRQLPVYPIPTRAYPPFPQGFHPLQGFYQPQGIPPLQGFYQGIPPSVGFPQGIPRADVLLNPYDPPLKDDRYGVLMSPSYQSPSASYQSPSASYQSPSASYQSPSALPINIMTNVGAVNAEYRQVGIITPAKGSSKNEILPLMGRPLFTNRQKWQYYSISNQHNNVKLPIRVRGRRGTDEYGVDELFDGDVVYVEGNKERFTVTLYDKEGIQYLG